MGNLIIRKLRAIIIDYRSRGWCKLPYGGHARGCPAWSKKSICPPTVPLFEEIAKPPFTLVAIRFNLARHVKFIRTKHPGWSARQAKCVLYWQGRVDKDLRNACQKIASAKPNSVILYKPEACGVNVFETCRKIGLILERNPRKFVYKIAIIGIRI